MADRPTTSRVGRPRARSAHQTPKVSKAGKPRSKSVQKLKLKNQQRNILQSEW